MSLLFSLTGLLKTSVWRRGGLGMAALVLCVLALPWAVPASAQDAGADIVVSVDRRGDLVFVDAGMTAPVDIRLAWQVMTDYERMPEFLPQLESSEILERRENFLRLAQTGRVYIGPIPWSFEYVREVELTPPRRIRSVIVGGSLASGEVITELRPQGDGTRISYRSEAVPGMWVPLGISEAVIRNQVRDQLEQMRDEMLRRQRAR